MIHFDLEDRYQDELVVGSAISRREGVIFSVVGHALLLAVILFLPALGLFAPSPEEVEARRQQERLEAEQREQENRTFVFVQPRLDTPAPAPPERAELSDIDRRAQAREAAPVPTNPLPFSRGESTERTETAETERAAGPETPTPPPPTPEPPQQEDTLARTLPPAPQGLPRPPGLTPRPQGMLGDALRNLERYVENETFNNPQGGVRDPGSQIQFDTKGVEFGPWVRRFVAQVRRNWFVPYAAMTFRGRVVLQFNIHKSGQISDLMVVEPSSIDAFNRAAVNAINGSNPTEPLPPEYPDEKALFTVTFYYNEQPGR